MGKKSAMLFLVVLIFLSCPSSGVMVVKQYNITDYVLKNGTVAEGTITNTNVSDGATFDVNQSGLKAWGMAAVQHSQVPTMPKYSEFSASKSWNVTANASTLATTPGTVRFAVLRANPAREEKILITLDSNSDVDARVWNSISWGSPTELTAAGSLATKRIFYVDYEQVSGKALAVYANTTAQVLSYRTWDGSSWSAVSPLRIGASAGLHSIVKLYPRNGTNQIMLLVSDANTTPALYAALWNGTSFDMTTVKNITSRLDTTSDEQSFDGAWEEVSGDFNVFWGDDILTPLQMMSYSGGSWGAVASAGDGANGDIRYVKVTAYPGTDRQAVCWLEFTAADLNCESWDGNAVGTRASDDTSEAGVVGRNFDVQPLLNTGGFAAIYGDSNDDWYDFFVCASAADCDAGTWANRAIWAATQYNGTDTSWGQLYADPYDPGNFTILALSQTVGGGWYHARAYCDAASCVQTEPSTRFFLSPINNAVTAVTYESADFIYDPQQHYRTEVWHNSTNTYGVPASFINVTAQVNVTTAANYSFGIYNWVAGTWNACFDGQLDPGAYANLVCNLTSSIANYRSQDADGIIRVAINGTQNYSSQGMLKTDFLQFYMDVSDDPPYFDTRSTTYGITNNTPMPSQNVSFYSLWYDVYGLGRFWLSHNASGSFVNLTDNPFSAANNSWANYSFGIPNSSEGSQFVARIYANDTVSQPNSTFDFVISVQNVVPVVGDAYLNESLLEIRQSVCVNATAFDLGSGVSAVWVQFLYPNQTYANITLADTGCNAGIAGDGWYGALVNVSDIAGNLTLNRTFATDLVGNPNSNVLSPQPFLEVIYPPNPIGGSNYYVGFFGKAEAKVVSEASGGASIYSGKLGSGKLFIVRADNTVSWSKIRAASNNTDMPAMDSELGLEVPRDKLGTYFNKIMRSDTASPYGMVAFQSTASATTARFQDWLVSSWGANTAASTPATAGTVQFIVLKASPVRNEKIMVTLDSLLDIDAQVWNGTAFNVTTEMTASGAIATKRSYDVAYEQLSGDAVIAFANSTAARITYRVWDGTIYLPNAMVTIGTAGTLNSIVNLIPKPNSDEMMMLVSDATANPKLYGVLWNGTSFDESTVFKISDSLNGTSDEESFSGAWEEASGDFNVYYNNNSAVNNILMRSFSGGIWGNEVQGGNGGDGDIRYVKAIGYPGTDRQMVCWLEFAQADLNCQSWDGNSFGTMFSNTSVENGAVGRNFDVAPLLGTDGGFLVMFGFLNFDWYSFMMCTSPANCDAGTATKVDLWAATQMGGTDTRWGQVYADPNNYGNFTLLGTSQTATSGWYRARIFCNATLCGQVEPWTNLAATSSVVYEGAYFAFDRHSNPNDVSDMPCGVNNTMYMESNDGNFRVGVAYTDENSNGRFNTGDNIIFCTDFNPNKSDFQGTLSDYEIVFPKSFSDSVDLYISD